MLKLHFLQTICRNCDMFRPNLKVFRELLNIGKTRVKNISGFLRTLKCELKYLLI
jgi:hypothetical protein